MLLPLLLILTFGMTGAFVVPLLIVEEKEKRTLDFLLSSPASLNEIIAGKALTGVVYTRLIAGLLLGINRQSIQNWPLTLLTVVLGLLFVVGVGLVIGSRAQEHDAGEHVGESCVDSTHGSKLSVDRHNEMVRESDACDSDVLLE